MRGNSVIMRKLLRGKYETTYALLNNTKENLHNLKLLYLELTIDPEGIFETMIFLYLMVSSIQIFFIAHFC